MLLLAFWRIRVRILISRIPRTLSVAGSEARQNQVRAGIRHSRFVLFRFGSLAKGKSGSDCLLQAHRLPLSTRPRLAGVVHLLA